jgi:phage terminase small subunit
MKKEEKEDLMNDLGLTEKNKIFCREYILDLNATRSYMVAYSDIKNPETAKASASRLLTNVNVKDYIEAIQKDLEKMAGISRLRVMNEHIKMAFSSIAHLHNTWIERKEFESLTEEQKSCIAEIDTKIQRKTEWEYDDDAQKKIPVPYEVEYVKIKLYDKQKSLDAISKMLGYDAPIKTELDINVQQMPTVIIKTNGD